MISTLKETPGGFYCSECHMPLTESVITCPFCGSLITNYENILAENAPILSESVLNEFLKIDVCGPYTYNEIVAAIQKEGMRE